MSGNEFAVAIQSGYKQGYEDGGIKELEKIKEEIKSKRDEWIKGQDAEWHTYDRCLNIVDKHIAKLKGE